MAKALDSRVVEYAYIKSIAILPNLETRSVSIVDGESVETVTIRTRISITYELLDAQKNLLDMKHVEHYIPADDKMTKEEYLTAIAGSFLGFAAADVEQLSGYVEA